MSLKLLNSHSLNQLPTPCYMYGHNIQRERRREGEGEGEGEGEEEEEEAKISYAITSVRCGNRSHNATIF
jgi:hypothetical protein